MREITRVGQENLIAFSPLLMGVKERDKILVLGCIEDGRAAGVLAAMLDSEDGRADIVHLYVAEKERKRGIGTSLLTAMIDLAEKGGIKVLYVCFPVDEGLTALFENAGFLVLPGESLCVLDPKKLADSKVFRQIRTAKGSVYLRSLSQLTHAEQTQFLALLAKEEIEEASLPLQHLDMDFSAAVVREHRVEGILLSSKLEHRCMIHYLSNTNDNEPEDVLYLLRHLTEAVLSDPEVEEVCFFASNPKIRRLAEKLCGGPEQLKNEQATANASLILTTAS